MTRTIAAALGLLLGLAAPGAAAQADGPALPTTSNTTIERYDHFGVDEVAALLRLLGLDHEIGRDVYNAPVISVTGIANAETTLPSPADRFDVLFFGCDEADRCDEISLVSHYTPTRPTSLTTINRFNQGTRFTTAYTSGNGDLVLSMDLSAMGGIGRQATLVMIAIYVYNMESFASAIGVS
ncbi:MAG: hypothetical protein HKM95_15220 [Inquilinus sp.]|nr:hypothetical protein [Inquilinus sp.]